MNFTSQFKHLSRIDLPAFSNTRVMMMPLIIGDISSIPGFLFHWRGTLKNLFHVSEHHDQVGYITIDEKEVKANTTHRRAGLHVDGVFEGKCGGWGGGGGSWGSVGKGMITVSSVAGCRAYNQDFAGFPGQDGECDHLKDQCKEECSELFKPNEAYWVDGLCVHESVPMLNDTRRAFVRLSMPSTAPWFEGYTENPLGVKPTGAILPRRKFMDMI